MIFHMYNTMAYTKECGYLLTQQVWCFQFCLPLLTVVIVNRKAENYKYINFNNNVQYVKRKRNKNEKAEGRRKIMTTWPNSRSNQESHRCKSQKELQKFHYHMMIYTVTSSYHVPGHVYSLIQVVVLGLIGVIGLN